MTTRPDRLVIVFADEKRDRPAAASYQTLIEVSPGRDIESLEPIDIEQLETLLPLFNAGVVAERDSAQSELAQLQQDYDSKVAEIKSAVEQRDNLTSQVADLEAELETIKNPVNPFPDADWSGFRKSALSDKAVQRVAVGNPVLWPLLLMFLNELSSNPLRAMDIAGLWNMMESAVEVTKDEIERVNKIAEQFSVPFRLNELGQIVG